MADNASVYLDACCFIDVVKFDVSARMEPGRANEVWYIKKLLQAHRDREITVYTSTLSIAEATHAGKMPVPREVQNGLEALLTSGQYVFLVQSTPFICMDARNLRWKDGIALKGVDAVHLASAVDRGCGEFLSLDGRFSRVQEHSASLTKMGVNVLVPSKTQVLPEKYMQGNLLEGKKPH